MDACAAGVGGCESNMIGCMGFELARASLVGLVLKRVGARYLPQGEHMLLHRRVDAFEQEHPLGAALLSG